MHDDPHLGRSVTLAQMLAARDDRYRKQQALLKADPEAVVVVGTVVTPGNRKRTHESLAAGQAMKDAICAAFGDHVASVEALDLPTGYEVYILLRGLTPEEVKQRACAAEADHPLGRLFDIDVLDGEGRPISRQSIGLLPRTCLLCGDDARVCMRLGRHSYDDLAEHIRRMVENYERSL